jgi:hypothetical protein
MKAVHSYRICVWSPFCSIQALQHSQNGWIPLEKYYCGCLCNHMNCLLYLSIRMGLLFSSRLFEWPKQVVITLCQVWGVWRMWKTLKVQDLDCCNCCTAVWGQALSCCKRPPLAKSPRCFDETAGRK